MTYLGEYGGVVRRTFKADVPYLVGTAITAEQAMEWPIANRLALYNTKKVEWWGPPAEEVKQRPAPAAKAEKVEKKEETKTPAVKATGRTKGNRTRGK